MLRCNSPGELYPLRATPSRGPTSLVAVTADLWHQRLGHPGRAALSKVLASSDFQCNKTLSHTCHACQTGKNVRLPFHESNSIAPFPFHILHCDVWTSPILSNSGFDYFLVILDDHSHFVWTFPLRSKSDVFEILVTFHAYVSTQFQRPILAFRTDNGREFVNAAFRSFLSRHGIVFQLSCPYTSQQNGRASASFAHSPRASVASLSTPPPLHASGPTHLPPPHIC